MNPAVIEVLRRCKCGHGAYTHTLSPKKVRTWCAYGDSDGMCECKRYVAGDTDSPVPGETGAGQTVRTESHPAPVQEP